MSHTHSSSSASAADTLQGTSDLSPFKSTFKHHGHSHPAPPKVKLIPPEHPFRTLVLCFDGTGDQFDLYNSNVIQLFNLLKKDDRNIQMVYYQSGIGTYTIPQIATPWASRMRKRMDEAVAQNLDAHVMGGYEFLMQNYIAGDRICIFGFSRGAYTARALAGMIHKVGLLPPCNHQQVPFAYQMYTSADDLGWQQSTAFKDAFCIDVDIEFIGVWDTVDSVGLIPKRLPFTTSNTIVCTFRHALSLDERRVKFKPNLWNRPTLYEAGLGTDAASSLAAAAAITGEDTATATATASENTATTTPTASVPGPILNEEPGKNPKEAPGHNVKQAPGHNPKGSSDSSWTSKGLWKRKNHSSETLRDQALEAQYQKPRHKPTDIEEVWFAGCHCDVGGGSVSNDTRNTLARIPLRWMIRECFKTKTGIVFEADKLRAIGLDPDTLYPMVKPRPPPLSVGDMKVRKCRPEAAPEPVVMVTAPDAEQTALEEREELIDALCPRYDRLSLSRPWWVLEVLPMQQRYQRPDNSWTKRYEIHKGSPRIPPRPIHKDDRMKVHRSVKLRMDAEYEDARGRKYIPRAQLQPDHVWVD